jgi:hypothetical protein
VSNRRIEMNSRTRLVVSLAIVAAVVCVASVGRLAAQRGPADPNIVVILRGTGVPVATPADVVGTCFETDLYDAHTDKIIGNGLDCLDFVVIDGSSFSINRTTVFNFPQGRLVASGLTTVVPIFGGSSPAYTHVVGDVDDGAANVVSGTNRFAGRTGNVRLSGIVNLGDFPNTIDFNCIFVIDLD